MRTTNMLPTALFREMDRGLSRWLGDLMGESEPATAQGETIPPSLDLFETPEAFRIEMDLPGVREEDVAIEIQEGLLEVRAERARVEPGEDEEARYVERRHDRYARRMRLPGQIAEDRIEAELTDGVLTILLPKAAEARPRQIQVKRNA